MSVDFGIMGVLSRWKPGAWWLVVCFLILGSHGTVPLTAQSSSATLAGTVLDSNEGVLIGAEVTLVEIGTSARRKSVSAENGTFVFPGLPSGRYVLRASLPGFTTTELSDITLNLDDRISIRVRLEMAGQTEGVTVIAESTRAVTSPAVSTVIDRKFVENLPLNGRSFQALLQLTPGVVLASGDGQFSINGQRSNTNYYTVDGVSANVRASGGFGNSSGQLPMFTVLGTTNGMVSVDALQELRVQTSTYAPEYGRTQGGQISMVTRSGTNVFHGSAFEYFRDEALDATDWFVNNRGLAKPQLSQHNFGGALGGPILKNQTFFFVSYEGLRLKQPVGAVSNVPSMEVRTTVPTSVRPYLDAFPLPNGRNLGGGIAEFAVSHSTPSRYNTVGTRIDHRFGAGSSVFGRVSESRSSTSSGSNAMLTTVGEDSTSVTGGSTWILSRGVVHDIRVNHSKSTGLTIAELHTLGGASPPPATLMYGPGRGPADTRFLFSLTSCCSWASGEAIAFEQRQFNIVDSLVVMARSHEIKMGVDFRRSSPHYNAGGTYFPSLAATTSSLQTGRGTVLVANAFEPSPRSAIFDNISAYVQDSWRLGRRTTTTYGVRWDVVPSVRTTGNVQPVTLDNIDDPYGGAVKIASAGTPLWKTRYDHIAARAGVTHLLVDKSRLQTLVRGGYGVFYDIGLGNVGAAYSGWPFQRRDTYVSPVLPLPAELLVPMPFSVASTSPQLEILDRNIILPRTHQWNVSLEQSLGASQEVIVSYVGAAGRDLLKRDNYRLSNLVASNDTTSVAVYRNRGYSDYRALQVQFKRRLHRGIQSVASYTWGLAKDTASADTAPNIPAERLQPEVDYGYADHDVRHVFNGAITYQQPAGAFGSSFWSGLVRDWGVDLLLRLRSASPVAVGTTTPFPPEIYSVRPDIVAGQPFWINDTNVPGGRRLNRAAFTTPAPSTQGNLRRGEVRGFAASQLDMSVRREFGLGGQWRLQFRIELFNLFNAPNFLDPRAVTLDAARFGVSEQMLNNSGGVNAVYQFGGARSSQAVMRVLF